MTKSAAVPEQNSPVSVPPHLMPMQRLFPQDLLKLFAQCSHPNPSIRERALDALLQSPAADEASFARDLLTAFVAQPWIMRHMPLPLAGLFLDVAILTEGKPWVSDHSTFFTKFLKRLGKRPFSPLLLQGLPLGPLLPCISQRVMQGGNPPPFNSCKNRWRLLRKRLLAISDGFPATALTLRDLHGLMSAMGKPSGPANWGSGWLSVGRLLVLPGWNELSASQGPSDPPQSRIPSMEDQAPLECLNLKPTAWGTMRPSVMRFWEAMEKAQAEELAAVRTLSRVVSQRTGRVVLSLHNATLAAVGGWAFEDPVAFTVKPALQQVFAGAVWKRTRELTASCTSLPVTPEALWSRCEERLVVPQLQHALWESQVRATFDPDWTEHYERELLLVEGILGKERLKGIQDDAVAAHALPCALAPHQRRTVKDVLRWRHQRQEFWSEGLFLLGAMIVEGQNLLDLGDIEGLVLPWIDKFFISSRRDADRDYLPLILQFLDTLGAQPLVLFWEDTSRAKDPSFKLALNEMKRRGLPFRGIGVFDEGDSRRDEALDLICQEYRSTRLFALRPFNDTHNPASLHCLLQGGLRYFLSHYDSSWKDNLCFMYAGTQVLPFVSVHCEMEPFPAWIVSGNRRIPFGAAFRHRLRRNVLGTQCCMVHPLSLRYAQWANLL